MIRVLVVDDSAFVRTVLTRELSKESDIEVVGTAVDPYVARERIAELSPDVLTLDLEMPRMDGLTFLEKLMAHHPLPVVVVSSLTPTNSRLALRALELGAVEVIAKPDSALSVPENTEQLVRAIRAAACARMVRKTPPSASEARPRSMRPGSLPPTSFRAAATVVALGASTGGTMALEQVLRSLPPDFPATVVVQHMPAGFTQAFAQRLDSVCRLSVREAQDGDVVAPGLVLIAPGGFHMHLFPSGAQYRVRIKTGPPVHHVCPAVDVLFHSVARHVGSHAVGAVLTGMGADGARGLLAMRQAGAFTLAEAEETCVVFGMPKAAIDLNAAASVVRLEDVPSALLRAVSRDA